MKDRVLNQDEINQTSMSLLTYKGKGWIDPEIFNSITQIWPSIVFEIVPLRKKENKIEIFLLKRDENDPIWPNMLHTPGTVIRTTDDKGWFGSSDLKSPFKRLLEKELNLQNFDLNKINFVGTIIHNSERGMECSFIHWIELDENFESGSGRFYDINELPDTFVKSQNDFIWKCIEEFKKKLF